jgi:O-antigen/teichoic acid export membrane protein
MIANLLFSIPGSISHSLFAEMTNFPNSLSVKRNLFRSLKFVYLLIIPVLLILLLISEWLLGVFGQAYVEEGLLLLRILAVSSLFLSFSMIYSSLLQALDRMKELVIFRVFTAMFVLTGSYMVLPHTGIIGIGYVWGGVQLIVAIASFLRLYYWLKKLPV